MQRSRDAGRAAAQKVLVLTHELARADIADRPGYLSLLEERQSALDSLEWMELDEVARDRLEMAMDLSKKLVDGMDLAKARMADGLRSSSKRRRAVRGYVAAGSQSRVDQRR